MVDDCIKKVLLNAFPFRTQQQFLRIIEQGEVKCMRLFPCQIRLMKDIQIKCGDKEINCYSCLSDYLQSMTCSKKEYFVCAERATFCDQNGMKCPTLKK